MDSDELRGLLKRSAVIAGFFAVAVVFYVLGRQGGEFWRRALYAYAITVAVLMVLAVLLQSGKGGGLAGIGGMAGESLLGTRSATPIAKATYVMGALLLFICMLIARMGQMNIRTQPPGLPVPPSRQESTDAGEAAPEEAPETELPGETQ